MGKLKGEDLAFIASHYEKISKAYTTQIYFCFNSAADGATAFNILKRVYADECNYDAWGGWFGGGDKRDFYLGFTSKKVRNDVFKEIEKSISEYRQANKDDIGYVGPNTGTQTGTNNTGAGTGSSYDQTTKTRDWTTYIIIGAAAVVIILLLWDSKKK